MPIPSGKGCRKKLYPSAEFHDHLAKLGETVRHGGAPYGGAPTTAPKVGASSLNADLRTAKVAVGDLGNHVPVKNMSFDVPDRNLEIPLPPPTPLPSLTAAFSRRRAIFGAVALAAAPVAALPAVAATGHTARHTPSALDPTAETDPVFAAIEKHRAAQEAFERSFDESVGMVHIPADIEDRQSVACNAEIEARHDMHQVVPTTLAGLAAYVGYWEAFTNPPGLRMTQIDEIGWEAIPTIAAALANLLPVGGARV